MSDLPEPLVSSDVDLKGFPSFMFDAAAFLGSELVAMATPEEGWAAVRLMARAWSQTPPGSLPDDDRILAGFSGSGKRWPKIRAVALHDFVKCADGRLYHAALAADARRAQTKKQDYQEINNSKTERQKRWRERVKETSAELRKLGITPPSGTSLETLEGMLRDARETSTNPSTPVLQASTEASTVDADVDAVDVSETLKTETGTSTLIETPKPPLGSKVPKPPPDGKGSRIDPGWAPSQADIAYAASKGLNEAETEAQVELFRNHYLGKPDRDGGRKTDWPATWRTWVLKSLEFRARRQGQAVATNGFGGRPTSGVRSAIAGIAAATAALKEAS